MCRGVLQELDSVVTRTRMFQYKPDGEVTFIPNAEVRSKTLCPDSTRPPDSGVAVRGWPVEASALRWIAPARKVIQVDPSCLGRPLDPS